MTDKCKMSERLDRLEELVQALTAHIEEIEDRTKPSEIRKAAQD